MVKNKVCILPKPIFSFSVMCTVDTQTGAEKNWLLTSKVVKFDL